MEFGPVLSFPAGTGARRIPVPYPPWRKPISLYAVCFPLFICSLNTLRAEVGAAQVLLSHSHRAGLRGGTWLLIQTGLGVRGNPARQLQVPLPGGHNAHLQSLGADWTPGTQISAPGSPLAAGWGPASDTDSVCCAGGLAPGSSARLQVCTPDPRGRSPGQHHCTSPALQPVPGVCPWRPPRTGFPSPKGGWEERDHGC